MKREWALWSLMSLIIIAAVLIMLFIIKPNSNNDKSDSIKLESALWKSYLKNQWLSEGRTISNPVNSITTSEAQSYTMLRAVWEKNQTVFKTTWTWTQQNLERPDHLFAWEWGKNSNGKYGIMTANNGQNSASDADSDIALSLLMASVQWHNPVYKNDALKIINAIWNIEVVKINKQYYLAADNLEKTALTPYIVVNPSYFSPYSYRIFDRVDPDHPWLTLASNSYQELQQMSKAKLGLPFSVGLPPDWVVVYRSNNALSSAPNKTLSTNFGYNAIRVIWRTALDWQWYNQQESINTLKSFSFLESQWAANHSLVAIYSHSGKPLANYSSYAMYGATLAYFKYTNPKAGQIILEQKIIQPLLNKTTGKLKKQLNYYDNNWLWFGLELYNNQLTNIAGGIRP